MSQFSRNDLLQVQQNAKAKAQVRFLLGVFQGTDGYCAPSFSANTEGRTALIKNPPVPCSRLQPECGDMVENSVADVRA